MSLPNPWPWLRPLLILTLAVSIPPLLYWFGYVQTSIKSTRLQAHTTLSAVGVELKERLEAFQQVATKAPRFAPGVGAWSNTPDGGQITKVAAYLRRVLPSKSNVDDCASPAAGNKPDGTVAPNLRLVAGADAGGLIIRVAEHIKDKQPCIEHVVLRLEEMVPWDLVASDFDGLLVMDSQGRLLAQDRRLPTQPFGIMINFGGAATALTQAFGEPVAKPSTAPPKSPLNLFDFSNDITLELAGEKYLVLAQQVRAVGSSSNQPTLRIAGLIRQSRLREEAISLSPQTIAVIGSVVALGLFAIPLLKLRFIGERERMRRRDVWWLGSSALFATALLVLLILNGFAHMRLLDRLDVALGEFVDEVHAELLEESKDALDQLRASAPLMLSDAIAAGQLQSRTPVASVLSSTQSFAYPDFEAMYAVDLSGQQTHKWMPRTQSTANSSVADRDYFQQGLALTTGREYFFDTVVSWSTGKQLSFISTPFTLHSSDADKPFATGANVALVARDGVLVVSTPMRSASDTVVPRPFQFVLVNREGRVSFHRAQGPFVGERFFDAVTNGDALANAARIQSLATQPRSFEYRGRHFRMQAVYEPSLQSTLVGFYEESVVSRVAARSFGVAAAAAAGVVITILLGAALMVGVRSGSALDWMYPTAVAARVYWLGCGVSVVMMLLLWLLRDLLININAGLLAICLVGVPLAIMIGLGTGHVMTALHWLGDKIPLGKTTNGTTRLSAFAFKTAGVMTVLSLVAWPTVVIFDDVLTLQARAFGNGVARDWRYDIEQRNEKLTRTAIDVGAAMGPPDCSRTPPDRRCIAVDRIYATHSNHTALLASWQAGIYRTCVDFVGRESCVLDANGAPSQASMQRHFTAALAIRLAHLSSEHHELVQDLRATRNGNHRALFAWSDTLLWLALSFAALVGVLFLLVRSVANHVLGIDIIHGKDSLPDLSQSFAPRDGTRWLLLRPGPDLLKNLRNAITVDLRNPATNLSALQTPAPNQVLVIKNLETRLANTDWHKPLRALLHDGTGCIVFTSEIDPLFYLSQRHYELSGAAATDPTLSARLQSSRDEMEKWAVALRTVVKIREAYDVNRLALVGADEDTNAALREEFGASQPLIEIGERLIPQLHGKSACRAAIVDYASDLAQPYYRSLWEQSSQQEQLVMVQLAQEGLVNPKQLRLVRCLAHRGLVSVTPHLQLMNESFARFVRNAEPRERIAQWEHCGSGSSWSRIGTPLYALAAVIIAILLFTQQDAFTNVLGMLTAAGGTLGSLRNLYSANIKPVIGEIKTA